MSRKKRRSRKTPVSLEPPVWHGFWPNLSASNRHLVSIAVMLLLAFGFLAPVQFSSERLAAGDTQRWTAMARSMIDYEAETGEPALWATNGFAGMPGYLISYRPEVPQVDDVFRQLRLIFWPGSHFIVLLLGMYLFVWLLTRDQLASVFAALAYGLTTYIPVILMAGHNSKFVALAWAPWLLAAFLYCLRRPSFLAGLLFAVAVAVNLRAGHIQITYYAVFVAGVWWAGEGIGALRQSRIRPFMRSTAWLAAGGVMALLMIAQPYLALAEYKPFTTRGASPDGTGAGMGWLYAMNWSQGIGELLTLIVPGSYGGGGGLYWGPKPFTAGPHYFGVLVVVLAIYAVVRHSDITTRSLFVAAFVTVLFSLGMHLPIVNRPMFDYFPMFSSFRVPETWLSITALLTAVLAGIGVSALTSTLESRDRRAFYGCFAGIAGVILVLMVTKGTILQFRAPQEEIRIVSQIQAQYPGVSPDDPQVQQVVRQEMDRRRTARENLFDTDARRSILLLVVGFAILWLAYRRKIPAWLTLIGMLLILTVDLGSVGRRYLNESTLSPTSAADTIPEYAFDAFILEQLQAAGGEGSFRVLSLENGLDPSSNARPSFYYESLGGYHAAKLWLYQEFLDTILFDSRGRLNPRALSMMNTRFVIGPRAVPGYKVVFQDDSTGNTVFENPDVLPRAWFVGEVERVSNSEAMIRKLHDDTFDPGRTVLFSSDVSGGSRAFPDRSAPIDSGSVAQVRLELHTAREISLSVETDAARWLVVSEVYYPAGWYAEIDGNDVTIERADYLLRAVYVPEGKHRVRLRFDPATHRTGLAVSSVSTGIVYLLLLGLLGQLWKRRRKSKSNS